MIRLQTLFITLIIPIQFSAIFECCEILIEPAAQNNSASCAAEMKVNLILISENIQTAIKLGPGLRKSAFKMTSPAKTCILLLALYFVQVQADFGIPGYSFRTFNMLTSEKNETEESGKYFFKSYNGSNFLHDSEKLQALALKTIISA